MVKPHLVNEPSIAEDLFELFGGDDQRFGTFDVERLRLVGDKMEMKDEEGNGPRDVKRPPSVADVADHLAGGQPMGLWVTRQDGMVKRFVIDIDGKDQEGGYAEIRQVAIVSRIEKLGLPLVDDRSKSGGVHLNCFLTEWVPQAEAYALGRKMAALLGFPGAEIFPRESGPSNWVILPYYGGNLNNHHSNQYCMARPLGNPDLMMSLADYRDFAMGRRVSLEEAKAAARKARPERKTDGPERVRRDLAAFCEEIADFEKGERGLKLYGRAKDMGRHVRDEWIGESEVFDALHTAAMKMKSPLTPSEATMHITNGLRDGKNAKPEDDDAVSPVPGDMVVWEGGDEIEWDFETGRGRIRMSVGDALHYWTFMKRCAAELGVVFQPMKQDKWNKLLNAIRRTAEIRQIPPDETPQSICADALRAFCMDYRPRSLGERPVHEDRITDLLYSNYPVEIKDENRVYYIYSAFVKYFIAHVPMYKSWSSKQLGAMVKKVLKEFGRESVDWGTTTKKLRGPNSKDVEVRWVRENLFDRTPPKPTGRVDQPL